MYYIILVVYKYYCSVKYVKWCIISLYTTINIYFKGGKVKRQTTSLKVDPELWKKVKIHAIKKGVSVSELIEDLLKKELSKK